MVRGDISFEAVFVRVKTRNNYEYTVQRHTMMMAIVSTGSGLLLLLVRVRMFVVFGAGLLLVVVRVRMSVVGGTFFMTMVVR